jgi:hypothetical protein
MEKKMAVAPPLPSMRGKVIALVATRRVVEYYGSRESCVAPRFNACDYDICDKKYGELWRSTTLVTIKF